MSVELGVQWEPNWEHGVLVVDEAGEAHLQLAAHFDDIDQRLVVIHWHGCKAARMEPPNDEAISGHRLYTHGLRDVRWVGEVLKSSLIADLELRNRVHPFHAGVAHRYDDLRHWIVPLKGRVVEVVAETCEVSRTPPRI